VTEKRIDESVKRILAAKYDLGLVKQRITPLDDIDRVVGSSDAVTLARDIAEHAITLVRDEDKLVPLKGLKPGTRIFNLAITNGDDRLWVTNSFVDAFRRSGYKIETVVLDERSSEWDTTAALQKAKSADLVIATLYGRVRSGQARSVGLPAPGTRALSALITAKTPIVGISFGNPYLLLGFPELRTYMVMYGDMPALQQAAVRALLGEIDITGKLPISLPGMYQRGVGIQIKKQR
jgi:beta-N-acetylhexosaminidase